ncbi:uncharacterized protein LOC121871895 isoform X2 [Homarus americanus]|uniref:Uncharacterized protein n=1 Tax=Homarus americanus TaxID=6706 RepID=A0A8J5K3K3_HOMAM|nr:uncharacterized protein LOC121871895 isoform X2 [Homarus americanus]KAG7164259.1 hypothetical protein Hamer_G019624 [Homarus americanus]
MQLYSGRMRDQPRPAVRCILLMTLLVTSRAVANHDEASPGDIITPKDQLPGPNWEDNEESFRILQPRVASPAPLQHHLHYHQHDQVQNHDKPQIVEREARTRRSVAGRSSGSDMVSHFGGIGNPGLLGFPISLGNSSSYLVPSEDHGTTHPPIYGGVGDDIREHFPLVFGGSLNSSNNQQFVSVGNQRPSNIFSASYSSPTSAASTWGNPPHDTSNTPTPLTPANFQHLFNAQLAHDNDLPVEENISSSSSVPVSSGAAAPDGLDSQYHSQQTPPKINTLQLLNKFYENFASSNPSYTSQQQQHPQNDPLIPDISTLDDASHQVSQRPYIPAYGNLQVNQNTDLQNDDVKVVNAEVFTAVQSADVVDAEVQSADVVDAEVASAAAASATTSASGCLSSSACALFVAIALAFGATSAFTIPFFAPGILGRRRRSIDYVVLSQDNATSFLNNYLNFLKNDSINISKSENLFFKALTDPTDDSTRQILKKLEHFILKNKDKLLNITAQELQLKESNPVLDVISENVDKTNTKPTSVSMKPSDGEMPDTVVSKHDNIHTQYTWSVQDHPSPLRSDGRAFGSHLKSPGANYDILGAKYSEGNSHNPYSQLHQPGVTTTTSTLPYNTQRVSHLNTSFLSRRWSTESYNTQPHPTNLLQYVRSVNTPYRVSNRALPDSSHYYPTPDYDSPYTHHPSHASGGVDILQRTERQGGGRERVALYRTVCSGLHHPHIPDNDITRFIANKCNILQYAGII